MRNFIFSVNLVLELHKKKKGENYEEYCICVYLKMFIAHRTSFSFLIRIAERLVCALTYICL